MSSSHPLTGLILHKELFSQVHDNRFLNHSLAINFGSGQIFALLLFLRSRTHNRVGNEVHRSRQSIDNITVENGVI